MSLVNRQIGSREKEWRVWQYPSQSAVLQTRLIGLEELLRRYLTYRISCPLRWVCTGARGDIYELPSMAAGKSDYGGLRKEADKVTNSKSA
jgi:hypothetical protein